jgi:hypothetical protein
MQAADGAERIDGIAVNEEKTGIRKHLQDGVHEERVSRIFQDEALAVGSLMVGKLQLPPVVSVGNRRILLEQPIDIPIYAVLNVELGRPEDVREHAAALVGLKGVHGVNRLDVRRDHVGHLEEARERDLRTARSFGSWRWIEALPMRQGPVLRILTE